MNELSFRQYAVSLERETSITYRRMAEVVTQPRIREVLIYLAEEEEAHIRDIEKMTSEAPADDLLNTALVRAREEHQLVFPDSAGVASLKSEEEILNQALHLEIQSVEFYKSLHDLLCDSDLKSQIHRLLDMELDHVSNLRNLLRLQQRSEKDVSLSQEEEEKMLRDAIAVDHARRRSGTE